MKKCCRSLTLSIVALGYLVASGQTPSNYSNPLELNGADPHVLDNRARDGYFYIYYTDGYATTRYRSTNLVNWENKSKGTAYNGSHAPHSLYWPDNDTYYLFGNYFRAQSPSASTTFGTIDNEFGFDQQWFTDADGRHYVLYGGANNPNGIVSLTAPTAAGDRLVRQHFTPYTTWAATFEGYWLHRLADGQYVLMLSIGPANGATYKLVHATAPSPEGPFALREWTSEAAFLRRSEIEGIYGPGHHCVIADDNGTLWAFYQQKDGSASGWDRKVALDPLWFDTSGYPHIRPTRGVSKPGPGSAIATLWPTRAAASTIQAESHNGSSVVTLAAGGSGQVLGNALPRAYAAYRRVDFGAAGSVNGFKASIACGQAFTSALEVRLGGVEGPVLAHLPFGDTGGATSYQTFSVPLIQPVSGIQDIVLVFTGPVPLATTGNLDWFSFTAEAPVGSTNQPPEANRELISVVGGQTVHLHLLDNDSDPDGETLNLRGRANATTTLLTDGVLEYHVPGAMLGEVQFSYSIDDGAEGFATVDSILKVAPSPGPHGEANGVIAFEAEDFHQFYPVADTNTWFEDTAVAGFSGRGYVTTKERRSTAASRDGSRLDYGVDITTPGLYHVWARVAAGTGGAGSDFSEIGVGVGAYDSTISNYVGMYDWSADGLQGTSAQEWHWVKLGVIQSLRAGLHRISLLRREDGHRVDRFVLASAADYDPASLNGGLGPDAAIPEAAARALAGAATIASPTASETGRILREVWWNIPGNNVTDLTGNARFVGPPDAIEHIKSLAPQIDQGDNFGARIRGWLHPSVTGSYSFSFSSDNQSETWLGTSDDPASKVRILGAGSSGTSAAVSLVADQRYYIEILHKEGRFGDNINVRWQVPGTASLETIPGSALSPWPLPPRAPERLRAIPVGHGRVHLLWGDISPNESAVEVERSSDDGATWQPLASLPPDAFTFIDTSVVAESNYIYRVRARNAEGDSAWSRPAAVSTPSGPPPVPAIFAELNGNRIHLQFRREANPDLLYAVWTSSDLADWGTAPVWFSTGTANTAGEVSVPDTVDLTEGESRFLQLRVEVP